MDIEISSLAPLAEIQRRFPEVRLFLFGSITQKAGPISDIDLLALYETLDSVWALKQVLNIITDDLQLHVVYMSAREEAQFGFIAGQQAVSVDDFLAHTAASINPNAAFEEGRMARRSRWHGYL